MRKLLLIAFAAILCFADDQDRRRDLGRLERKVLVLERRARKLALNPDAEPFWARETNRLLELGRDRNQGEQKQDRFLEALEDLLDAREQIAKAGSDTHFEQSREEMQSKTARRLERGYFRVQQAEYFAKLSAEPGASEYVTRARQLYQVARGAYDKNAFGRAERYVEASGELVNVLENLAQAAAPRIDPPRLK